MKKYLLIMILSAFGAAGSLFSQDSSDEPPRLPTVKNPSVPSPKGLRNIKEVKGDLDGNGTEDLLIAYETDKQTDFGKERQIHIFKKEDKKWKLHKKFTGPLLPSDQGGVMGDPFQDIQIKKGVIIIEQSGGSRDKWSYIHRFRKQNNNWELIGATVNLFTPCEKSDKYDYNLNTGKVEVESAVLKCDENGEEKGTPKAKKSSFSLKKKAVLMENFKAGENEVKIPGKKDSSFSY